MPFIEVEEGVKLFVEDSCTGSLGCIVFIHGWPSSSKIYEYQFQHLSPLGYRCIAIDLRGFGSSDKPWGDYDYDLFVRDIRRVLEKLEVSDAVLAGHSMGGAIAMHYVATQKAAHIRKLVLISAAAPSFVQRPDFPFGTQPAEVDRMIKDCRTDRAKMLSRFGESCFSKPISPALARWFHSMVMNASPYATIKCLEALRDTDLRKDMREVRVPTLIMHGGQDTITPFALAEILHEGIKGSRLVSFSNSGHGIFYEDLQEFNQHLIDFTHQGL
jgi:non-heme chloroperoxidase